MSARAGMAERFAALGPWRTRFVIDGHEYGGDPDVTLDRRVMTFFEWFGTPRTILELGCGEGGHTVRLAASETTERVLGVESDPRSLDRAKFVVEALGMTHVGLALADLETVELAAYGSFGAVFCADLLHRLAAPWRLLVEAAQVSRHLFLDTHYWTAPQTVEIDGYCGGWVGTADGAGSRHDATSGFWLTRPSLLEALTNAGWAIRHIEDESRNRSKSRLWLRCVRPPTAATG